jgi:hypothetical protein
VRPSTHSPPPDTLGTKQKSHNKIKKVLPASVWEPFEPVFVIEISALFLLSLSRRAFHALFQPCTTRDRRILRQAGQQPVFAKIADVVDIPPLGRQLLGRSRW